MGPNMTHCILRFRFLIVIIHGVIDKAILILILVPMVLVLVLSRLLLNINIKVFLDVGLLLLPSPLLVTLLMVPRHLVYPTDCAVLDLVRYKG
ncbi:hypothetical protein GYMLUDRAFT_617852 [Collybiopsis luxurians FD-317 M1]|uniref:Uncharacterized protein n=1 Tax=Collybiopsis luxurians FD-317 M1 TaxID=944289 RepID=A0A0D0CC14_9AGAR|nr:hypothetical protein GYMLUDRAFT_617852 [Collybiopsis luxurians FD-317 M1]